MSGIKKAFAPALAMILTAGLMTAPATAQQRQNGLVNIQVGDITTGDILTDINVGIGVAANIAANVCGVSVGVIASQVGQTGAFSCQTADQFANITQIGS